MDHLDQMLAMVEMSCWGPFLCLFRGLAAVTLGSSSPTLILELFLFALYPDILLLICLHYTGIIYVKHSPNLFPTFDLNFSICAVMESSGPKSLPASWQEFSAFTSQYVLVSSPYGSVLSVCQSSVSA